PLRERDPALPQEEGREGERGQADGDVDEEDPLPAEAVDDRAADQPGGRRADAAERAPNPECLVALGSLLEGGGDDRDRGRGHDRGPDPLEGAPPISAGSDQASPQESEATVKRTTPTMNTRRRPSRSAARPPSRSRPAKVSA